MSASAASRGNDPERWEKLLNSLDDKLQLGLLDHLRRITAYHFEEEILYINPGSEEDEAYLRREHNLHQLELLAQDATGIERVKIKKLES